MYFVTIIVILFGLGLGCTHTPVEWRTRQNFTIDGVENETLCRVNWFKLLEVNVAQMKIKENQLWVVVAQHYIAASLNKLRISFPNHTAIALSESILFLGNTLEHYCDNISQWTLGEKEDHAIQILSNFNHGLFPEYPSCEEESSLPTLNTTMGVETFYYYQSVDTFIVRDYVNNETITRSEFIGIINTNLTVTISFGFLVVWLLICFLKMAIDSNFRKRYSLWKKGGSSSSQHAIESTHYVNEKAIHLDDL